MKFYVPFTEDIRVEDASRHVWYFKFNREFLHVVDYFVKWSENFFCVICNRSHKFESSLRNCLFYHRNDTLNYFIDHELIPYGESK